MLLSELQDKKILIVGFGREGQDSFLFLRKKFPKKNIGIADKKKFEELPLVAQKLLSANGKIALYLGSSYTKQLRAYDVIIKSPGIPANKLAPLLKKKQILTSQTNIFFANCTGTIIGVTGTKGKSTTSSLIYELLKSAKKKVHLIGNIEQPVLRFLGGAAKNDIFVYELSSGQLEIANKSPHIALFLNFYPEHLNFHKTLKAYREAKANITKLQTEKDYFIFNETSEIIKEIAATSKAKKYGFKPKKQASAFAIAATEPVFLVGKIFNIPKEKIEKTIKQFKPLPHRLQPIGTYKGIQFYNDSLATIPEATIAALDTLGSNVRTLLVGGFDRGLSMEKLALRILKSELKILIAFPTTGNILLQEIEQAAKKQNIKKIPKLFFVNSMATAVQLAYTHTPKGKICLLSPAASSFNLFRDYKERGEEFQKLVTLDGEKKSS